MRVLTLLCAALLLTLPALCGCSPLSSKPSTLSVTTDQSELTIAQQVSDARLGIAVFLAADNPEQAGTELLDARRKSIAESHLGDLYTVVGNRLLQDAPQAVAAGRPDSAGRLYRMAREIYPEDRQRQATIVLSLAEIDEKLGQCADQLLKKGLIAYRSGDLAAAVEIWKKIGRFYPDHPPSQVAISTTEQQLRTLENLAAGAEK
jgi:tetratricopeptide (TPR) repeat protein